MGRSGKTAHAGRVPPETDACLLGLYELDTYGRGVYRKHNI